MQILPRIEGRFAKFVAPARPRNELWRLVLSSVLVALAFLAVSFLMLGVFYAFYGPSFMQEIASGGDVGQTPQSILYVLSGFGPILLAVWGVVRWLHRRPLATVFGASPGRVVRNGLISAAIVALFTGIGTVYTFATDAPIPNMELGYWLKWMMLVLPLLLIQVTTEEVIFRGFLQQQLAARFSSPWVWMILPSILFGSLHYQPSLLGDNAWLVVVVTALIGIFAADLTARTGNIGASIGLHFVNNFFAMCLLSLDGGMSGVSLYTTPLSVQDAEALRPVLLTEVVTIMVAYAIYLAVMRRFRRT